MKFERRGRILTVTMDNPPLNAANFQLHDELSRVFHDIERDSACDVVVVTGAGRAFSAGGDFAGMLKSCDDTATRAAMMTGVPEIVHSLLRMTKPVIARVNGHAIGLGATLALLADVVFAVENAKFGDPHINIGLSTGDGGAFLWPLMIGFARARHHLLTGEPLTAVEAMQIGLIHKALPTEQLDEHVNAYADRLLKAPQLALRLSKRSINMTLRQLAESVTDAHAGLEHLTMASADHREAVVALMEKREPVFTGK